MGAQTTIMQRFFLPHPLDTIVSQPFGMTEDLVSMAMAEATSDPVLASASLTALIVSFNLARGLIFTGHSDHDDHTDEHPFMEDVKKDQWISNSTASTEAPMSAQPSLEYLASTGEFASEKVMHKQEGRDYAALSSACLSALVGVVIGFVVAGSLSIRAAFLVVVVQMMVQLLAVPVAMGRFILPEPHHVENHVKRIQTVASERHVTLLLWLHNQKEQTDSPEEMPAIMSWSSCQKLAAAGCHAARTFWRTEFDGCTLQWNPFRE